MAVVILGHVSMFPLIQTLIPRFVVTQSCLAIQILEPRTYSCEAVHLWENRLVGAYCWTIQLWEQIELRGHTDVGTEICETEQPQEHRAVGTESYGAIQLWEHRAVGSYRCWNT